MFVEQVEMSDKLRQMIDNMTQEFIAQEGWVTCEFSIQEKYLVAVHQYIYTKNRELPSYGLWRVYMCETCIDHNAAHPYHVDILVCDERPKYTGD